MASRWLSIGLALVLFLPGCAAKLTTMAPPSKRAIRGVLHLPATAGRRATTPAMASAHGGHDMSMADTPADAVIYLETLPVATVTSVGRPAPRSAPPAAKSLDPRSNAVASKREAPDSKPAGKAADATASKSGAHPTPRAETTSKTSARSGNKAKSEPAAKSEARLASEDTPPRKKSFAFFAASSSPSKPMPVARSDPKEKTAEPEVTAPAAPLPSIGQVDHCFVPRVLPVPIGATVRFENRDRVYHNVFSVSPARRFDTGKYAPRQSKEVTFDAPGVVQLYCDIDPSMAGFVFVTPTRYFTQPDANGAFALPDLPPGTYTLKVWHPTLGRLVRKVELTDQADASVTLRY